MLAVQNIKINSAIIHKDSSVCVVATTSAAVWCGGTKLLILRRMVVLGLCDLLTVQEGEPRGWLQGAR